MTVLITGGTGNLGSVLRRLMQADGTEVRVLSRRERPQGETPETWATGDLKTGEGLQDALTGISTVIHCATDGRTDVASTERVVAAAKMAGVQHLLFISIVGVDRHPLFYYRAKYQAEQVVERSGLPWTILRATQFHDLVYALFTGQRWVPVLFAPAIPFQTIAVEDVARRLAKLAAEDAVGRVKDIGGPEVLACRDMASAYLASIRSRRRVVPLALPGKVFGAYAAGLHLAPDTPVSGKTFAEFLADRQQRTAP
jgi:uncharacterized protein YbjT (DUF2867 family)